MDIEITVLRDQMIMFFIFILCGFLGVKIKLITREMLDGLAKLILSIIMPCMYLSILPNAVSPNSASMLLYMIPGGFLLYAFFILLGILLAFLLRLKGDQRNIHIAQTCLLNAAFFGIPLAGALLGPEGTLAISLFTVVDSIAVWTFGVIMATGSQRKLDGKSEFSLSFALKKLCNPCTISVAVGLVLLLLKVPVDNVPMQALSSIGGCTKSLAMVYIGGTIAFMDLKGITKAWPAFSIVIVRMIGAPLFINWLLNHLPWELPSMVVQAFTLLSCLPAIASYPLIAKQNGSDAAEYSSQIVMVTTLCCLVTIPLVSILTQS
ncbi:AEC family transporter [Youxingia wuxianensis]|uniref:AEC family transporter n=1 Tax=Youxingia wuxianensis TaxID=2763678 RepID=A0A926IDM2_9FIRM|nr:AEC family transporter [Youxingia wuxianensis]MBC8586452.1 AEC family transporter [Youxingia wuxianensis]